MTAKATRQTMTKFLKERAEDKIPDPFAALALEYLKIWASKGDYSAEMTDQDIERCWISSGQKEPPIYLKPYQKPTNYLLNYKGKAKISKILSFEEISYQEIVDISKNPLENYIILPRMADKKHDYYQKILINQKFIGMIQGSRHDEFVSEVESGNMIILGQSISKVLKDGLIAGSIPILPWRKPTIF